MTQHNTPLESLEDNGDVDISELLKPVQISSATWKCLYGTSRTPRQAQPRGEDNLGDDYYEGGCRASGLLHNDCPIRFTDATQINVHNSLISSLYPPISLGSVPACVLDHIKETFCHILDPLMVSVWVSLLPSLLIFSNSICSFNEPVSIPFVECPVAHTRYTTYPSVILRCRTKGGHKGDLSNNNDQSKNESRDELFRKTPTHKPEGLSVVEMEVSDGNDIKTGRQQTKDKDKDGDKEQDKKDVKEDSDSLSEIFIERTTNSIRISFRFCSNMGQFYLYRVLKKLLQSIISTAQQSSSTVNSQVPVWIIRKRPLENYALTFLILENHLRLLGKANLIALMYNRIASLELALQSAAEALVFEWIPKMAVDYFEEVNK